MLRVIFDTNVYGHLFEEADVVELEQKIVSDKSFVVYGFQLVRKELRDSTRDSRIFLLELYDRITKDRMFMNSEKTVSLAKGYYRQYREAGGSKDWGKMGVDFMVVACATLNNLDVVCSGDEKTLMSELTQLVYKKVHILKGHRTPNFWNYEDLLERFRKR
ncbi:MAG TPA: hypothetical protein VJG90_07750 [Candidatus Nanoarchaeia archaeon]|nr:hypothetical protein [Candidatus Nanoarchaeia archaeon]